MVPLCSSGGIISSKGESGSMLSLYLFKTKLLNTAPFSEIIAEYKGVLTLTTRAGSIVFSASSLINAV